MSAIKRLKKKVEFEHDVARCGTCKYFNDGHVFLMNSMIKKSKNYCNKHHFVATKHSLCNDWLSKRGETLVLVKE